MLPSQLKSLVDQKLPKKIIILSKVSFFCIILHIFLIAWFFLFSDVQQSLYINTLNPDAPVVFVPFLKSVQQPTISVPPVNVPLPQRTPEKVQKSVIKKVEKKTPAPKKVVPKKAAEKKQVPPPKKELPKPVVKPEPIKTPEVKPEVQKQSTVVTQADEKKLEEKKQEVVQAGYDDRELLVLSDHLKRDILKTWKRPTNIPTNAICQLRVVISKEGERQIIVDKSSQAIALDISARNFLLRYEFPVQLNGKELTIIF